MLRRTLLTVPKCSIRSSRSIQWIRSQRHATTVILTDPRFVLDYYQLRIHHDEQETHRAHGLRSMIRLCVSDDLMKSLVPLATCLQINSETPVTDAATSIDHKHHTTLPTGSYIFLRDGDISITPESLDKGQIRFIGQHACISGLSCGITPEKADAAQELADAIRDKPSPHGSKLREEIGLNTAETEFYAFQQAYAAEVDKANTSIVQLEGYPQFHFVAKVGQETHEQVPIFAYYNDKDKTTNQGADGILIKVSDDSVA